VVCTVERILYLYPPKIASYSHGTVGQRQFIEYTDKPAHAVISIKQSLVFKGLNILDMIQSISTQRKLQPHIELGCLKVTSL
jgi:hypothetical protein